MRVKVSYFYKTSRIFNDFSRENHGHGGHEHGVHRGVFGSELSFKKMSAGGRLSTLQENPHFRVPTIKVRPPDGTNTRVPRGLPGKSVLDSTWKRQAACTIFFPDLSRSQGGEKRKKKNSTNFSTDFVTELQTNKKCCKTHRSLAPNSNDKFSIATTKTY